MKIVGKKIESVKKIATKGHASSEIVHRILKDCNVSVRNNKDHLCSSCQYAKSHRLPYQLSTSRAASPLDLVYTDIWGPAPLLSTSGARYFILFVDDNTSPILNSEDRSTTPRTEVSDSRLQLKPVMTIQPDEGPRSSKAQIADLIAKLNSTFALRDLGLLTYFLGIEVSYDSNSMHLCQTKYISDLLDRTDMKDCKPAKTPGVVGKSLSKYDGDLFEDPTKYRSVVGALQYVTLTRPDISFAVNKACQFMQSPTTAHWLSVKQILREDLAGIYTAEIVSAASHLYANEIMHRDLKPDNIILDVDGHAMFADFGFAKQFAGDTRSKTMCGRIEYMSPQVFLGKGYVKATDWWGVGSMLFEMLTGHLPIICSNRQKIQQKIIIEKAKLPAFLQGKHIPS
ncbi:hypothetical protein HHK36_016832 [Tetracentron sinense]|uniref:Protein kinase domain-containing protein n=1 Tax=Tetracentron sinense TaxID=13715 RepID=A0A835DEL7_TETSI|nr:hypothetical protein HHK36_016832 [Tetracentron sinense]